MLNQESPAFRRGEEVNEQLPTVDIDMDRVVRGVAQRAAAALAEAWVEAARQDAAIVGLVADRNNAAREAEAAQADAGRPS